MVESPGLRQSVEVVPVKKPEDCAHEDFAATVAVGRMLDTGKFIADIKVNCTVCGVAMRFVGVPAGISYSQPMAAINSEELHAPIEPAYQTELLTSARFEMPEIPKRH